MNIRFNGSYTKKVLQNFREIVLAALVPSHLKGFGEVMVVGDWMTFLMRREQLTRLLIEGCQQLA